MFKNNPALLQLRSGMQATVSSNKTIVEGEIRGTRQGYGFLQADDGQSYFVSPPQMSKCLPGDRVKASILKQEDGKTEAIIESITEGLSGTFIGTVRHRGANPCVVPENQFIKNWFRIPTLKRDKERDGDIVIANIIGHPFDDGVAKCEIVEIVCNERDKNAAWKSACARYSIDFEAPVFDLDDVPANSSKAQEDPTLQDLRRVPFVTIDGEYTRDIDDALHAVRFKDGRIRLTVAIADAERFIIPGSKTDLDAFSRGFSTYLPGLSIPMLPKVMSEQGASLMEGEERHAIFCTMDFNNEGEVTHSAFTLGSMCSHAKLSYESVQDFLGGKEDAISTAHHHSIKTLNELCTRRGLWREKHALVSSGYSDYRFVVEDFVVKSVGMTAQTRSQKLVEECMVAANIEFGAYMNKHSLPCVYRRHDGVKEEKAEDLVEVLKHNGIATTAEELGTLEGFKAVMRQIETKGSEPLNLVVRGYMARGRHDTEFGAHFSIGLEGYATFTSPIRKYSDLINHRSMKNHLIQAGNVIEITEATIEHLDKRMSDTDRAERDVYNALYAKMYEPLVGKTFPAKVVGVLGAGARVEMEETGASGFISTRTLGRRADVFDVSADGHTLMKNGTALITLGETMDVVIEFVDVPGRSINCAPNPAR
ncbi:VacB/RNase II family 3'-5' exoribonuclease [Pseudomonas putida]|uniref:exoribonuclease II n=1 Tax=Pseudomonas putida TaxID=303 RepID=A0A8I1JK80_PSEPU|nr:VacB/RNase II family 3'-5' exoribonuclease [Pseudomonas putida]MBI6883180.1 VacB/RNase II family 3'-5' exoribonuclease [Pseudomonas putida]